MTLSDEFAAEAAIYHQCALDADGKVGRFRKYLLASAPRPAMLLMAFSIELALKSYLMSHGKTDEDVRKHGHNLVSAWKECEKYDALEKIKVSDVDIHVLTIINDLHQNLCLRYRRPSELGSVPVFGPLTVLSDKFLKLCEAPTLWELEKSGF